MPKRKCRGCSQHTEVTHNSVIVGIMYFCDNDCRINYGIINAGKLAGKSALKRAKQERSEMRKRKVETKHKHSALSEAQKVFNQYIRLRDRYNGQRNCICCDRPLDWGNTQGVDSGHYLPVGGNAGLRFNLHNVHAQSSYCNRYRGGDSGSYRDNLIIKIGLDRVAALEDSTKRGKYSNEYLQRVKRIFSKKVKIMKKRLGL